MPRIFHKDHVIAYYDDLPLAMGRNCHDILIVDDEAPIRRAVVHALADDRVLEAGTAQSCVFHGKILRYSDVRSVDQ